MWFVDYVLKYSIIIKRSSENGSRFWREKTCTFQTKKGCKSITVRSDSQTHEKIREAEKSVAPKLENPCRTLSRYTKAI